MIDKLKTAMWFAQRPAFWPHAVALALRKFQTSKDSHQEAEFAAKWAAERALPVGEALRALGLTFDGEQPSLPNTLMAEARDNASRAAVQMGGPGDLDLLYAATLLSGARRVVETGVAYGWSSLAVLAALEGRDGARLASVDMPYPRMNNEAYVGIAVPARLRDKWALIREPDRNGLRKAVTTLGGEIDLCHYDSDKSTTGRAFGFPIMWAALRSGGVFISDDIQDNLGFKSFVETKGVPFAVTEYQGKFVGICRKP